MILWHFFNQFLIKIIIIIVIIILYSEFVGSDRCILWDDGSVWNVLWEKLTGYIGNLCSLICIFYMLHF